MSPRGLQPQLNRLGMVVHSRQLSGDKMILGPFLHTDSVALSYLFGCDGERIGTFPVANAR